MRLRLFRLIFHFAIIIRDWLLVLASIVLVKSDSYRHDLFELTLTFYYIVASDWLLALERFVASRLSTKLTLVVLVLVRMPVTYSSFPKLGKAVLVSVYTPTSSQPSLPSLLSSAVGSFKLVDEKSPYVPASPPTEMVLYSYFL